MPVDDLATFSRAGAGLGPAQARLYEGLKYHRGMVILTTLEPFQDDRGNEVRYSGPPVEGVRIKFTGSGNTLIVSKKVKLGRLFVDFDNDGGLVRIGASKGVPAFSASIRVGQDSAVTVGANVSTTSMVTISACEGTKVRIGDDVMLAAEVEMRADDAHPIFDVRTGARVNVSRSITVGNHVWIARRVVLLGGSAIGDGAVVGIGSVVTQKIPNNVVVAGVPARVVRRDIAWERPHLSLTPPFYKPDASTVTRSEEYWNLTQDPQVRPRSLWRRVARRARGIVRRRSAAR